MKPHFCGPLSGLLTQVWLYIELRASIYNIWNFYLRKKSENGFMRAILNLRVLGILYFMSHCVSPHTVSVYLVVMGTSWSKCVPRSKKLCVLCAFPYHCEEEERWVDMNVEYRYDMLSWSAWFPSFQMGWIHDSSSRTEESFHPPTSLHAVSPATLQQAQHQT